MSNASMKKCLALFQFIIIYFQYFIFKRKVKTTIEVQCKIYTVNKFSLFCK